MKSQDYSGNSRSTNNPRGLFLIFYYQFNQVVVIKSEEITNISSKFNKNTLQSANPLDLILKIKQKVGKSLLQRPFDIKMNKQRAKLEG